MQTQYASDALELAVRDIKTGEYTNKDGKTKPMFSNLGNSKGGLLVDMLMLQTVNAKRDADMKKKADGTETQAEGAELSVDDQETMKAVTSSVPEMIKAINVILKIHPNKETFNVRGGKVQPKSVSFGHLGNIAASSLALIVAMVRYPPPCSLGSAAWHVELTGSSGGASPGPPL